MTPNPVRRRWLMIGLLVSGLLLAVCSGSSGGQTSSDSTGTTAENGRKFPLIAPGGLRPILDRERRRSKDAPATTALPTTTAPTPIPTAPPRTEPFFVGQLHRTFVDPTRSTPSRGGTPASNSRTIQTTIYYPTTLAPSSTNPTPRVATGTLAAHRLRPRIRNRRGRVRATPRGPRLRWIHCRRARLPRNEHCVPGWCDSK